MAVLIHQLPSILYQKSRTQLRKHLRSIASIGLILVVVLVYLANGRSIGVGDTVPARYLPISVLREFNFDLDEFKFLYDETGRRTYPFVGDLPYFLHYRDGHYFSVYPPGPALLALPLYVIPVIAGMSATSAWVVRLEKLSATLITALSVLFLFWTLRELTAERWALIIASVYAFGTSSLSISSQALWQHGPSQFCLTVALYLLVKGIRKTPYIAYVGFPLATSILMRPSNVLLVVPLGLYVLHQHRSILWKCGLGTLLPLAFLLLYNYSLFGSIGGGYGPGMLDASSLFWQTPFWEGLSGLLLSPGRGLFIYSPIFLLSLVGIVIAWTSGPLLFKYLSIGPVLVVLLYSRWSAWWGGWTYGPRLLADLAPFLCLFLYPFCTPMDRWRCLRAAFMMFALLSIGCHVLGAFWYDYRWDGLMGTNHHPERLWQWSNSPLVYYAKEAFVSGRRGISSVAVRLLQLPTSGTSPQQLAAAYTMRELDPGLSVYAYPCGRIYLSMEAVNRGKAVWLARRRHNRGEVRLAWRWLWEGQEMPTLPGWEDLPYDIFPGQRYAFSATIAPPAWPSDYTLEVGLVTEAMTWFSEQGTDPLKMAIRVVSPVNSDFESALAQQVKVIDDPPQVTITLDQPRYWLGRQVRVMVNIANGARGYPVDAYFAVVWPDGRVSFQDHSGFVMEPEGIWKPLVKNFAFTQGQLIQQPLLDLKLPEPLFQEGNMPSGCYTCYLILTEPDTYQIIATARALFWLEPL
jgi:hypothetical protein